MDLEALRKNLRACFPPLSSPTAPAFFDNGAGTLVPFRVVSAVGNVLASRGVCNSPTSHRWGREQQQLGEEAHQATALFMNAPSKANIATGATSTELTFRLSSAFARMWGKGDAVVISELEHECNASPWRALKARGVEIRVWRAHWPAGFLDVRDLQELLADGKVRLVAMTAASNALGLTTPVRDAARLTHEAKAWICVDWVHMGPHALPDVVRDDLDFLFFSCYKIFAPHMSCLYIRKELATQLDVPTMWFYDKQAVSKFEFGTPSFEAYAGWLASLKYLIEDVGGAPAETPLSRKGLEDAFSRVAALEAPLREALVRGLSSIPGVVVYGDRTHRVATVSFTIQGHKSSEVAGQLSDKGTFVSSGNFYATMPIDALGLTSEGLVRASVIHYNSLEEVNNFVDSVRRIATTSSKL